MKGSGKKLIQNDKIMKMAQITYSHSDTHTPTGKKIQMKLNSAKESVEHIALNRALEFSPM